MRVLRLTGAIAEKILAQRRGRDLVAERTATRIIRDVQRRGDLWEAMHSPRERKRIERARPLTDAA